MKRTLIAFTLLSFVLLGIAGCQTEVVPPINEVTYAGKLSDEPVLVQTIRVPGVSVEAARDAVLKAGRKRGWNVETLASGDVSAKLTHRTSEASLTFKFGAEKIDVYSVSYKIDKETQVRIEREAPEGWIRNLHKDILGFLGLLPSE